MNLDGTPHAATLSGIVLYAELHIIAQHFTQNSTAFHSELHSNFSAFHSISLSTFHSISLRTPRHFIQNFTQNSTAFQSKFHSEVHSISQQFGPFCASEAKFNEEESLLKDV